MSEPIRVSDALVALRPGAEWNVTGNIYSGIEWLDKGHVNNDYTEPADQTETYYYMKNVTIPAGVTLQLTNNSSLNRTVIRRN